MDPDNKNNLNFPQGPSNSNNPVIPRNLSPNQYQPPQQAQTEVPPEVEQQPTIPYFSQPQSTPFPTTYPATEQIIPNQNPIKPEKPKSKFPKILLVLLLAFFLLFLVSGITLAFLISYDVYHLPFAPDAQDKLKFAVLSLPFTKKTPEFIVEKALFSHKKIASHDFELSAAFDAPEIGGILPLAKLDAVVKGDISYKDPTNILTNLEMNFNKDFDMNLLVKDKIVYFKVNKLPTNYLTVFGFNEEAIKKHLEKWYFIDTEPLDSEARIQLDSTKKDKPITDQIIEKTLEFMNDRKIQSAVKLESTNYQDNKVYKLSINADDALTDYIFEKISEESEGNLLTEAKVLGIDTDIFTQSENNPEPSKPSDVVKNFYLEAMFDRRSYLLRKSLISFDIVIEKQYAEELYSMGIFSNPLTQDEIKMRFSLATTFDNFAKEVEVNVPDGVTDFDELTKDLLGYSIKEQQKKAVDAKKLSDIMQLSYGVQAFFASCQRYPANLNDLASDSVTYCARGGKEMAVIPKNSDGTDYYYSTNDTGSEYHLCANLMYPETYSYRKSPQSCPDPSYNYHISSLDPTPTPYYYYTPTGSPNSSTNYPDYLY
ncbi:MAG TPA: hypothetical protein VI819_00235 [Patescibacteria group bacterium]|nr:hypothetical protein [Patescibacteria group bacterium]